MFFKTIPNTDFTEFSMLMNRQYTAVTSLQELQSEIHVDLQLFPEKDKFTSLNELLKKIGLKDQMIPLNDYVIKYAFSAIAVQLADMVQSLNCKEIKHAGLH